MYNGLSWCMEFVHSSVYVLPRVEPEELHVHTRMYKLHTPYKQAMVQLYNRTSLTFNRKVNFCALV